MPRGGRRNRTPGKNYTNRTDLQAQPVRVAPARVYGDATRHREAQQAMPLAQLPEPPKMSPTSAPRSPAQEIPRVGLYDPSLRPDEPVYAGLDVSPAGVTARDKLIALYRRFPDDDLRRLIERII